MLPTRDRKVQQGLPIFCEAVVNHQQIQSCITQEVKACVAAIGSLRVGAVDGGLQSCSLLNEVWCRVFSSPLHSMLSLQESANAPHILTNLIAVREDMQSINT